jgi:lipoate-protein ligase A
MDSQEYAFSENELTKIHSLVENKYGSWKWNYGYSPDFEYLVNGTLYEKPIQFTVFVKEGQIHMLKWSKGDIPENIIKAIESDLIGMVFYEADITSTLLNRQIIMRQNLEI